MCSLDCVTSLIFFDTPVSRMLVQLLPTCRPHRSLFCSSGTLFWILQYFQHIYCHSTISPEMFATRIYPNHTVCSMCRLDILGTHMEEDESPDPRSDASTWIAWQYDGTIQDLNVRNDWSTCNGLRHSMEVPRKRNASALLPVASKSFLLLWFTATVRNQQSRS